MLGLIDLLEQFNRKERYFLVGQALGNEEFRLSEEFRTKLGCELGIKISSNASAWMDYHLDAVAGSLWRYRNPERQMEEDFPKRNGMVVGNHQDIDLLIAFKERNSGVYRLVFLEAKGYESDYSDGYARWDTKEIDDQMQSKVSQLKSIFGVDKGKSPEVKPHFCLMSHLPSEKLTTNSWPAWMSNNGNPHWLQLNLPSDRLRVTRCHQDGKSSENGDHFRIIREHKADGTPDKRHERGNPDRITKAGEKDKRYSVNR